MRAGLLNRRIQLTRRIEKRDQATGEDIGEWVPYAHVWAQVVYLSGREAHVADQTVEGVDQVFRIRWRRGVVAQDRVVYEGRAYDIIGLPQELGNREALELRCTARAED